MLEEQSISLEEFAYRYACQAVQSSCRGHNFCYKVPIEGNEILLDSSWREFSNSTLFHHFSALVPILEDASLTLRWEIWDLCMFVLGSISCLFCNVNEADSSLFPLGF